MAKADKISTFLGEGTEIEGELKLSGAVRLNGHFKGKISGEGTLIIGEEAKIESDIYVSNLFNCGEIQGNVTADEKIVICAGGKVIGSIQTPVLVIHEDDAGSLTSGKNKAH